MRLQAHGVWPARSGASRNPGPVPWIKKNKQSRN